MEKYAQHDPAESADEEIVILYKEGERDAFKILMDRYTPILFNFTARLTNRNDAEDIVEEIFIKVWKNITNFDPARASFKTWIFTIAKNATTDFLRKKKSLLFSDMEGNTEDETFSDKITDEKMLPDEALQKLQDKNSLQETMNKLSLNYKEVLLLHYQEEMTFEEIGEVLNKPLNTVKSQHRRAIIELRKILMHQKSL